jgi:hypothetical protein
VRDSIDGNEHEQKTVRFRRRHEHGELRSFDKSAQLSPGKLGVNAAAKAAIRAGNYILAADNRGIAKDAIGDQMRMLDEIGRMTYDTRHQYLAGRHLDRLPGSPFVLMSHVAGLEGIRLRLIRENQIDDVFQRQVVSMRTVPAAPNRGGLAARASSAQGCANGSLAPHLTAPTMAIYHRRIGLRRTVCEGRRKFGRCAFNHRTRHHMGRNTEVARERAILALAAPPWLILKT